MQHLEASQFSLWNCTGMLFLGLFLGLYHLSHEIKVNTGEHTNKVRGNLWIVCLFVCVLFQMGVDERLLSGAVNVIHAGINRQASLPGRQKCSHIAAVITQSLVSSVCVCVCVHIYVCTCPMKANLAWQWRWLALLLSRWANTPFSCRGETWGGTRTQNQTPASTVDTKCSRNRQSGVFWVYFSHASRMDPEMIIVVYKSFGLDWNNY